MRSHPNILCGTDKQYPVEEDLQSSHSNDSASELIGLASAFRRPPQQLGTMFDPSFRNAKVTDQELGLDSPGSPDTFLADVRARRARRAYILSDDSQSGSPQETRTAPAKQTVASQVAKFSTLVCNSAPMPCYLLIWLIDRYWKEFSSK